MLAVTLAAVPTNSVSEAFESQLGYLTPFFGQSWRLFAPNPIDEDRNLLVQGAYVGEDGEVRVTPWVDWTSVEQDVIEHRLVGGRAGYISTKIYGALNEEFQEMEPARAIAGRAVQRSLAPVVGHAAGLPPSGRTRHRRRRRLSALRPCSRQVGHERSVGAVVARDHGRAVRAARAGRRAVRRSARQQRRAQGGAAGCHHARVAAGAHRRGSGSGTSGRRRRSIGGTDDLARAWPGSPRVSARPTAWRSPAS